MNRRVFWPLLKYISRKQVLIKFTRQRARGQDRESRSIWSLDFCVVILKYILVYKSTERGINVDAIFFLET